MQDFIQNNFKKFNKKLPNGGGRQGPGGWKIAINVAKHAGSDLKLLDKTGKRIATLWEDGSVRGNKMNTSEILKEMNITFDDEKDSLFDFFLKHKETKVLDIFPKTINDNEKYRTVEVFYQKVLDHCMKKQEFENIENRFLYFVKILWLYNETYVNILSPEIFNNYYYKRNKKILKKNSIVNLKSIAGTDEFLLIKDKDVLGSACIIATRDISPVVFYFRNSKILFLLNGCTGLLYYGFPKDILFTKRVANNCSLYLHKAEANK